MLFLCLFQLVKANFAADGLVGRESLNGTLNIECVKAVQGLLVSLDEPNNDLILKFRAAYIVYQTDPIANNDYFVREIARIRENLDRLKAFKSTN